MRANSGMLGKRNAFRFFKSNEKHLITNSTGVKNKENAMPVQHLFINSAQCAYLRAQSLNYICKGVGQRTEIPLPCFFKPAEIPEMQMWSYFPTAAKLSQLMYSLMILVERTKATATP